MPLSTFSMMWTPLFIFFIKEWAMGATRFTFSMKEWLKVTTRFTFSMVEWTSGLSTPSLKRRSAESLALSAEKVQLLLATVLFQ